MNNSSNNKKIRMYVLLGTFIVIFAFLVYQAYRWDSERLVRNITYSGNSIIPQQEINSQIKDSIIYSAKDKVSLEKIHDKVAENPYIKSTNVTHTAGDAINVELNERIPAGIIVYEDGNMNYVDTAGVLMPYRIYKNFPDLPLLRGVAGVDGNIDSSSLAGCLHIIADTKIEELKYIYPLISEIEYNKESSCYSMISSTGSFEIILGKADEIKNKLENLKAFWSNEVATINPEILKYVDLRWKNRVTVAYK
jgi:cell division septal protein FtsQ